MFVDTRTDSRPLLTAAHASTRGMTLVEILVVLAIIGLIMGGVALVAGDAFADSQKKEARRRVLQLVGAVEMYQLSHAGRCPNKLDRLRSAGLVRTLPVDPWGTEFKLQCPDEQGSITVTSAGKDGEFGNEDDLSSADEASKEVDA